MIKKNQDLLNRLNIVSDGILVIASLYAAFYIRFFLFREAIIAIPVSIYRYSGLGMAVIQMIAYALTGVYQPQRKRRLRRLFASIFLVNLASILLLLSTLFVLKLEDYSRGMLLIFFVLETGSLCFKHLAARLLLRQMRKKGFNQKYIILIGSGSAAKNCWNELNRSPELGSQVVGYLSRLERIPNLAYLGKPEELSAVLERIKPDEVIAAMESDEAMDINALLRACDGAGVRFSLIPPYTSRRTAGPQIDMINDIPLLVMRRVPLDYVTNAALKRSVDVIGSALLLLVLSPLLLAIAIGIRLSSPGPVIFRQTRIGYKSEPFVMYKFRSMVVNSEENSKWTTRDDPRRTGFGAFLRKWSLDELPQLFNVLKGDMSLVGPRPERPFYVEKFRENIPQYMIKHLVRPGMTGLAQIHGLRGDTSIEKRIEMDVYYIENWSPWLDIQILLKTLGHVKNDELLPG